MQLLSAHPKGMKPLLVVRTRQKGTFHTHTTWVIVVLPSA